MRKLVGLIVSLAVFVGSGSALAQEFGQYDAESYPKKLVTRPLLLAPSMFEVRFGGASNLFAGEPFGDEDRFRSKVDFRYAVGTRFQFGADSELDAFPTDDFAVRNLGAWAEYNLVPTISGRVGAFMVAPRDLMDDLDAKFGVRAGLPMKFRLGDNAALVAHPSMALLDGDSIVSTPVGLQLNIMEAFAVQVDTGIETINFEFDDDNNTWNLPLGFGGTLSLTRKIDATVQFRFTDIANDVEDRWVLAFFAFRG